MYEITAYPYEGLMLTFHPRYGRQFWSLSKLTRKHQGDSCAVCEQSVGNYAYRPITNLGNRSKRICTRHVENPAFSIGWTGTEEGLLRELERLAKEKKGIEVTQASE